ncbi:MAG: ureidoglycolate lyase [Gammaproteobacteria bacterium]|jgi:ureidoglycolate lyase
MQTPVDYLSPDVPDRLAWHDIPLIKASNESLQGYGCLVDDADNFEIEITQWPAQDWRPIDAGTGDEGGVVEGVFHSEWQGDILKGRNDAVQGDYVLGWRCNPGDINTGQGSGIENSMLLWHMNYHPDGGQLFFPMQAKPFVVPVALPGDDLTLERIVAFWCDGSQGLYIHPGIWHEGVFPVSQGQSFQDRQGRVHARVSCNICAEFGVFLQMPLPVKFDSR